MHSWFCNKGIKSPKVKRYFNKKVSKALTFLRQHIDLEAYFLPLRPEKILLPKFQMTSRQYFSIPNPQAFLPVTQDRERVIKGSGIMGFKGDPQTCLDEAGGDLRMLNCSIFYKRCQEVDTNVKLMLLVVPISSIHNKQIQKIMDRELIELEIKERKDPKSPVKRYDMREWVKYTITREYPPGMPWKDIEEKKQKMGTSGARLVYILHVHQPDYEQIKTLLQIAKQKKLWRNHWGKPAFTIEQPESKSPQGKKTRYIQILQAHRLVQLSMGASQIRGVGDIDNHFTQCLTPDAKNKPREPTVTLIREVFEMMEVQKKKVWICIAENANRSFTGYFSSVVAEIKDYVQNFITCLAVQVFWWLLRRWCLPLCLMEDVNKLIQYRSTLEQQRRVTMSKYLLNLSTIFVVDVKVVLYL